MSAHPSYLAVLRTFARNSLVRNMTFRGNFIAEFITSLLWTSLNLLFYLLIFQFTDEIGKGTGWHKHEYFVFLATTMTLNGLVQLFFMPNTEEFSELIRTGRLDFALLKPIDTQFLVSLEKFDWAATANITFGLGLLAYALSQLHLTPHLHQVVLYPLYLACGVAILYSLMIALASTSIWMGRNQSLYDFWFYVTTFSRYPMEIYRGPLGAPLRQAFTFVVPILIATNVPARLLAKPMQPQEWRLALFAIAATAGALWVSRRVFQFALRSYRSASS